jgi:hypothetical protein
MQFENLDHRGFQVVNRSIKLIAGLVGDPFVLDLPAAQKGDAIKDGETTPRKLYCCPTTNHGLRLGIRLHEASSVRVFRGSRTSVRTFSFDGEHIG